MPWYTVTIIVAGDCPLTRLKRIAAAMTRALKEEAKRHNARFAKRPPKMKGNGNRKAAK